MNAFFRKSVSVILVNLISLVLLCSCVNVKEPDDETITTNAAATDTVVDTENPFDQNGFLKDNLPADINLGGRVVTTLYWSDVEHEEFKSETLSGDLVNDAIFSRNSK